MSDSVKLQLLELYEQRFEVIIKKLDRIEAKINNLQEKQAQDNLILDSLKVSLENKKMELRRAQATEDDSYMLPESFEEHTQRGLKDKIKEIEDEIIEIYRRRNERKNRCHS